MSNTTTLNLPYKRFVAQVSTGAPRSKSTFLSLMTENLEALKACPWREATDVPVALADHDFTKASHFSDACDAFKMTGNYDSTAMTEVAYAGMAAYRFKIPASALVSGSEVAISSVSLPISRDRFLKGGVRIAWELTSRATPSTSWDTVRGGESPAASAYLSNPAAYLTAAKPTDGTKAVDLSGVDSGNPSAYLWIYVTLEDYTDWWDKYTSSEARQYAIEGSAMLVGGSASFTFDGAVTPDAEGTVTLLSGGSSPTWLQPLPTVNATDDPPTLANIVETFFTSAQTQTVPQSNMVVLCAFQTTYYSGTVTASMSGDTIEFVRVDYTYTNGSVTTSASQLLTKTATQYPDFSNYSRLMNPGSAAQYLSIELKYVTVHSGIGGATARYVGWGNRHIFDADSMGHQIYGTAADSFNGSEQTAEFAAFLQQTYYLMLQITDGVPTDMDRSTTPTPDGRQYLDATIEGSASPWSILLDSISYSVGISGSVVTLGSNGATLGTWSSTYDPNATTAFDPAANIRMPGTDAYQAVARYGLAATVGDFSHAVATFEAGTLPSDAEILGRLARMSRKAAGAMAYLHPATCALADELDVLRPVPRFFRAASAPDDQTECQPGISAWYCRPSSGSVPTLAFAYRDGAAGSVVKVADPVFLQLAFLALRAPAAIGNKLVLTNGSSAQPNGFRLRLVAWASPAEQWDGSNAYAMAAMGSMPSVYRSDGDDSVSWWVDCSGLLMPLGTRAMTAQRIGVSEVVDGDIEANARIEIPLDGKVGEGDVVLIAPEVLGFKTGTVGSTASVHFGRQSTPSASANGGAWARYAQDLGWFPQVTGE